MPSFSPLKGDRCLAGDRIGLEGEREAVDGVNSSKAREEAAGLECALVMVGAVSVAPLDRERRWLLEYGDRFRGLLVTEGDGREVLE